ncbi:MAG: hypothetical protein WCO08_08505 [Actinomycetes bacterium]
MSERNFLSWIGFKGEEENTSAPSENAAERIRQLESQLADLRSRRDLTTLSEEEFEILATETATTIIKSAQHREAKATEIAQKVKTESEKSAKTVLASAEAKATQIVAQAEAKGRKFVANMEAQAAQIQSSAESNAEGLVSAAKREVSNLMATSRREADQLIADANAEVAKYREWLATAVEEADRLYRVQNQSLAIAEQGIAASRAKLTSSFEKLAGLQASVKSELNENGQPITNVFKKAAIESAEIPEVAELRPSPVKASVRRGAPVRK